MSKPGWREWGRGLVRSYWTPAGKQALRNFLGLGICTAISQACALGVLLILTHSLSPAAFGAVIFALNLQTYLVTLGTFGLATVVIRDLAQRPEKADEITTAFLTIVGTASLLTGLLTAVVVALVPISWDERAVLWCVAAGNVAACLNLSPLFDAAHKQTHSAVASLPAEVLLVAVLGALASAGSLDIVAVGFCLLARLFLVVFLQAVVYLQLVRKVRWRTTRERVIWMVRAGQPMMWAGLLYAIPMSGSVILIRMLQTTSETATYGLAYQIVAIELIVSGIFMRVAQPHIVAIHGVARSFVMKLLLGVGTVLLIISGLGLSAGWVLTHRVLEPHYSAAFPILAILQVFLVCYVIATLVNVYLLRAHMGWWVNGSCVAGAALYLALIFVARWSDARGFAWAAAWSSVALLGGCAAGLCGRKFREQLSPIGAE